MSQATIHCIVQPIIEEKLFQGKGIVIYGARRVGKTTLSRSIMSNANVSAKKATLMPH